MGQNDGFADVTSALYDAVLDPAAWPGALDKVTTLCGATGAQFLVWNNRTNAMDLSFLVGFNPYAEFLYGLYYGQIDPRRQLVAATPVGQVIACHEHFDDGYARRSEFYSDFLIPQGGRYLAAARLVDSSDQTVVVGIHRGPKRGPFEPDDHAIIERLVPHLQWAAELRRRLGVVRLAEEAVAVAALDGLKAAVVIADTSGRVILMNRLAETLIAQSDGLSVSQGRLMAREQKETDALHEMLLRAAAASRRLGKALPVALSVSRPSGKRPYALVAAPIPERMHMAGGAVLIHVIDPETQARPTAAVLRSLFHLTPAEADLACRLLAGLRIEEVAAERSVQLTTVRTQLQALFAKTSTNRQAELIRLLTRLTAVGSTTGEE